MRNKRKGEVEMVDPANITNYNLTNNQLEEHILFWVAAAGKNGTTAARCLEKLLSRINYHNDSPFESIRACSNIPQLMRDCGMGCYTSKSRSFLELANSSLNLRTCSAEDLEKIYGIGMKTSRCFILHTREGAQYAGLDTHMLKNLRKQGIKEVPNSTPGSKKLYLRLEQEVLRLAKENNMAPADYDLMVWNNYKV
jgi:thermostable 8-oxoguanine DNA glycosylase